MLSVNKLYVGRKVVIVIVIEFTPTSNKGGGEREGTRFKSKFALESMVQVSPTFYVLSTDIDIDLDSVMPF
jgi:hypothetical protein